LENQTATIVKCRALGATSAEGTASFATESARPGVQWARMKPTVGVMALVSLGFVACGSGSSMPGGGTGGSSGRGGGAGSGGDAGSPGGSGGTGGAAGAAGASGGMGGVGAGGVGGGGGGAGGRGGTDSSGAGGRGGSGGGMTGGAGGSSGAGGGMVGGAGGGSGTTGQGGHGGAGGVAGSAGGRGGQGGGAVCAANSCVDCCTTMTPGGPSAYYNDMLTCSCAEPCYTQACKTSCNTGTPPDAACIACVRANLNGSLLCLMASNACAIDATCKTYADCVFASCP
jgi:hypothetical protein